VFFLITSDILPLKSLNVENPQLNRDTLPLTTQLIVVMDAQQVIYVGSKNDIVDFGSIKEHLNREIQFLKSKHRGTQPTIVLSVDKRVDYGAFLRLFSEVQQCGSTVRLSYKPT